MPLELFADNATGTVSSGGTTAPAAGTSETWTVTTVTGTFPAASNSANPATAFRIWDSAVPGEWMLVTNVSGTTWTVTRGIEGTPAAHTTGFTVANVVTSGFLNQNGSVDTRQGAVNIREIFGAKGDLKQVTDGAMTSSSATLTSATAGFTAADVGKTVEVVAATSTSMTLATTIASVTNGTTIVLKDPARASQTSVTLWINGRTVTDGVTTNDSTTVTSATAAFTSADAGTMITASGAGRVALITTISGFTNSTTVTLAASATRTTSGGVQVIWGTDDTTAFTNGFAAISGGTAGSLYIPAGWYYCASSSSSPVAIGSNTRVFGDGWSSIVRAKPGDSSGASAVWAINFGSGGSSDPSTNITNVVIEDLHLQGTVREEGFNQNSPNWCSFNACSDVLFDNVKFSNFRSDALYLGSGTTAGIERHNERVRVEECTFDGINGDNRNAISVIDCSGLHVSGCTFRYVSRLSMPGAIDLEPNSGTYSRVRGINIEGNYFFQCGGQNGTVCSFVTIPQDTLTTPFRGVSIVGNVFENCPSANGPFSLQQIQTPLDTTPPNDIVIDSNVVINCGQVAGEFEGVRGAVLSNNFWDSCGQGFATGFEYLCRDVNFSGNTFYQVGGSGGDVVTLYQAVRTGFTGNTVLSCGFTGGGGRAVLHLASGAAGLATPSGVTVTVFSTSGGTVGSGTHGYRVAARVGSLTTVAAATVTVSNSGTTNQNLITWNTVPGATDYQVYGRTSGSELLMTTVLQTNAATQSFTDTGSVTPSGALPGANTSGNGFTDGITLDGNKVTQPTNGVTNMVTKDSSHVTTAADNYQGTNVFPTGVGFTAGLFQGIARTQTMAAALTSAQTTTSTTPGSITGLSIPNVPAGTYLLEMQFNWQQAVTTTSPKFGLTGPTASAVSLISQGSGTAGGGVYSNAITSTAYGTVAASNTTITINTPFVMNLNGLVTTSAAGTFQAQFASGAASDTLTCSIGSYLRLTWIAP